MDTDKDTAEAEQWKRKYFDQLEEAESNEKQWQAADELLRRTVSRLTLAAEGQNPDLDRQLRELRNAIRDRVTSAKLKHSLESLSDALVKLDRERKEDSKAVEEADPLGELLDALSLPKGTGRAVKALRKQLDGASGADRSKAVAAFSDLIHAALELSAGTPAEASAKTPDKGGLLSRLFGAAEKNGRDAAASGGEDDGAPVSHEGDDTSIRELLIRLLERLSLPDDLSEQLDAVRERIESNAEPDAWPAIIEQIAELVQAIRSQTQKEKQGIETFLLALSERLEEVDRQLADSEQYYDDSFAAGEKLDSAVKQGITGLRDDVREATDLDQVRQRVETHIETVLEHMAEHRESEQQRYEKAKAEITQMNARLDSLEDEAEGLREQLHDERRQAQTDALTGIPNRLAYEERLGQEVARWKRFGTPLVLLVWDIDYFKKINDTYGHKAGDKVLRTLARTLAQAIRETDFLARYGGEEFVQLMTGSVLADCLKVADKLRELIESTGFHFRGESVTITASCGLAQLAEGDSMEQWFERADQALYQAKREGRNRCIPAGEN